MYGIFEICGLQCLALRSDRGISLWEEAGLLNASSDPRQIRTKCSSELGNPPLVPLPRIELPGSTKARGILQA